LDQVKGAVGSAVSWVDSHVVQPVVAAVKSAASWVNNNVVQPVVSWVGSNVVQPVQSAVARAGQVVSQGVQAVARSVQGVWQSAQTRVQAVYQQVRARVVEFACGVAERIGADAMGGVNQPRMFGPGIGSGPVCLLCILAPKVEPALISLGLLHAELSPEHTRIQDLAAQWEGHTDFEWTDFDGLRYILEKILSRGKIVDDPIWVFTYKYNYIANYSDVIKDAAQQYGIPAFLLAGVAYSEFAGDAPSFDDAAFIVRGIFSGNTSANLTSFGNVSMQVRRGCETLGYECSAGEQSEVIRSLENPIEGIYMAAAHLRDIQNVDYAGRSPASLTMEDIQIIAARYNLGPNASRESALSSVYGADIVGAYRNDVESALG
jgi:hypothetical protein